MIHDLFVGITFGDGLVTLWAFIILCASIANRK